MERFRLSAVLLCFFLSGFAALLYQTVWTREFAFVFGTSELAIATVLAAYMGGLAVGAAVAGRLTPLIRRPVLAYGLLELGIALSALAVPFLIRGCTALLGVLFGGRATLPDEGGAATTIFYLVGSFLILLVPTGLMGATLPLLARHAVSRESEIGTRVGLLYAVNTLGAVAGTATAGFLLLPTLGLRTTVSIGVLANAAVFLAAASLARTVPPIAATEKSGAAPERAPSHGIRADRSGWVLPIVLFSGVTSFSYEVLWTRLLGHLLGGSVYAFSTMLGSFLAGIAGGSFLAARLATTRERGVLGLAAAELLIAVLTLAAFATMDSLPELAGWMGAKGQEWNVGADALIAASVLLPAALAIGATFPFAVRVIAATEAEAGPASARVYAWNTLGAIAGAIGTGFFAIPYLGYTGTVAAAVLLNVGLALWALSIAGRRTGWALSIVVIAVLALSLAPPTTPWRLLRASPFSAAPSPGPLVYYGVGRSATVMLLGTTPDGEWNLRTNGLPEATIQPKGGRAAKFRETAWLGALPVMARPNTQSMLVIGLGGGLALESAPGSIEQIDVIELESKVVSANAFVGSARRKDPLADPRVRVTRNDARGAMLLTDARWDAIVSQPSHPWTAGASHLYTREFFELARTRLNDGGVFVQWIGLGMVDESLLRSIIATLHEVFPYVRLYRPVRMAALFLASDAPLDVEGSVERAIAAAPLDYASLGIHGPEDVAATLALDETAARAFATGGVINTDDYNYLASRSPRILGHGLGVAGADEVLSGFDPLMGETARLDRAYLVRRLLMQGAVARAEKVAATTRQTATRSTALGLVALARGQSDEANRLLRAALDLDSNQREARAALMRMQRQAIAANEPGNLALVENADALGRAIAEAWRHQLTQRWDSVRALDASLAGAKGDHPFFIYALRLRAQWRLSTGEREAAREALDLIDLILAMSTNAADVALRGHAAALAGYPGAALVNFRSAVNAPGSNPHVARLVDQGLRALPSTEPWTTAAEDLRSRMSRAKKREKRPRNP